MKRGYARDLGMVLVTTIFLVFLISSLVLSWVQLVMLYSKAGSRFIVAHTRFYQLESLGHRILQHYRHEVPNECLIQRAHPNDVLTMLLHQEGCKNTVSRFWHRFFIEDLGVVVSSRQASKARRQKAHHWRLTIREFDITG